MSQHSEMKLVEMIVQNCYENMFSAYTKINAKLTIHLN